MSTVFFALVAVFVASLGMSAQASGDVGWAVACHAVAIFSAAAAGNLSRD